MIAEVIRVNRRASAVPYCGCMRSLTRVCTFVVPHSESLGAPRIRRDRSRSARVPLLDPGGVEVRVLDRLARGLPFGIERDVLLPQVVAVACVQRAVARLDDRRVVIGAGLRTRRVKLQVSFPLPALPLIV